MVLPARNHVCVCVCVCILVLAGDMSCAVLPARNCVCVCVCILVPSWRYVMCSLAS